MLYSMKGKTYYISHVGASEYSFSINDCDNIKFIEFLNGSSDWHVPRMRVTFHKRKSALKYEQLLEKWIEQ